MMPRRRAGTRPVSVAPTTDPGGTRCLGRLVPCPVLLSELQSALRSLRFRRKRPSTSRVRVLSVGCYRWLVPVLTGGDFRLQTQICAWWHSRREGGSGERQLARAARPEPRGTGARVRLTVRGAASATGGSARGPSRPRRTRVRSRTPRPTAVIVARPPRLYWNLPTTPEDGVSAATHGP
jgi:hypothetical protein